MQTREKKKKEVLIIASHCEHAREALRVQTIGLPYTGPDPAFMATLFLSLPSGGDGTAARVEKLFKAVE